MKFHTRQLLSLLALLLSLPAMAHEFWMLPDRFALPQGNPVHITLHVGEYFEGEVIPFTTAYVAGLTQYSAGKTQNLLRTVPAEDSGKGFRLVPNARGTHLIAFDSHPNQVTLSGDKFHAYLREEGLEAIIKRREAGGTDSTPGRERYRRHVKTLLKSGSQSGGKSDNTFAVRTGQRFEILPLTDPYAARAGDTLNFQLFFDDKPLQNGLVKAWHQRGKQTVVIRVRTDAAGKAEVSLPHAGTWMISAVHMIAADGVPGIDWDSFWGNLTFELPPGKSKS